MDIMGKDIVIKGRLLKKAMIREEWDDDVQDPEGVVRKLEKARAGADIFTFIQRIPESRPRFNYPFEWQSVAAIPIENHDVWWNEQLTQEARNKVRKSLKKGLEIRAVELDENVIQSISRIYNETPLRQGKPFKYFGAGLEEIRQSHSTFGDRSHYLGAFYKEEMIGFLKLVSAGRFMRTMYVISMIQHRDKAPVNALIAKAVELCSDLGFGFLVYGKYSYGNIGSETLQNFKKFNGFENVIVPRYDIPLTWKGKVAIMFKLHKGLTGLLPVWLVRKLLVHRVAWYRRKFSMT